MKTIVARTAAQYGALRQSASEIVEADPLRRSAERVGQLKGLYEARHEGTKKKNKRTTSAAQQQYASPDSRKCDASAPAVRLPHHFPAAHEPGRGDGRCGSRRSVRAPAPQYLPAFTFSNWRSTSFPRATASSIAFCIGFCPSRPAWISSLIAMFAWALLPRRNPLRVVVRHAAVELDAPRSPASDCPCSSPAPSLPRRPPGSPARSLSPCATRPASRRCRGSCRKRRRPCTSSFVVPLSVHSAAPPIVLFFVGLPASSAGNVALQLNLTPASTAACAAVELITVEHCPAMKS